ncbi:MAG TPA: alpha/beta hydrolase [Isosphaeraceae bacterium]|jgi:pimeloyl-ACP methyl ester carboxylesterase
MRTRLEGGIRTWAVLIATALATLGATLAQERVPEPEPKSDAGKPKPKPKPKVKAKAGAAKKKLPARPGALPKGVRSNLTDALAQGGGADAIPDWPYHFQIQLVSTDGTPLAAVFYPSRLGPGAPAVLLIHETGAGRAGKDFEEPIAELKNQGLAGYLQEQGYAVLIPDLRGHGGNPRRELDAAQWRLMAGDLQVAYQFLIDRHNRQELNLAKFAALGVGDGANLIASWAVQPTAAVSVEGRISDLAALVLVAPVEKDIREHPLRPDVSALAPRLPMMLASGRDDAASVDVVGAAQAIVERHRQSKVELFETRLHGARLIRFVPKVPDAILRFLEDTIKFKTGEWEPRYNLNPVAFTTVGVVGSSPAAPAGSTPEDARPEPAKTKAADPGPPPAKKEQP